MVSLIAAEAYFVFRKFFFKGLKRALPYVFAIKKQKVKSPGRLLYAQGHCPAKRTEPGLEPFALLRTLLASTLLQNFLMPLQPHKATIVLPVFIRSFPADGYKRKVLVYINISNKKIPAIRLGF
jgi:hypothetical protein